MTGLTSLDATAQTSPVLHAPVQNASTMADVPKVATSVQTGTVNNKVYQPEPVITSLDFERLNYTPGINSNAGGPAVGRRPHVEFRPLNHVDMTVQTSPIKLSTISTETECPSKVTQTEKPLTKESFTQPLKAAAIPSTEASRQFIPVKNTDFSGQKTIMAQFGQGNTHPVTPQNYLKTFNIRAPVDQVNLTCNSRYMAKQRSAESTLMHSIEKKTCMQNLHDQSQVLTYLIPN